MLRAVLILFAGLLLGQTLVRATGLPLPGAVVGLLALLIAFVWRGGPDAHLRSVSGALLHNMSVLFVPAGVGLMTQMSALRRDLWPIAVAIPVSTILGMIVTAWVMTRLAGTGGMHDDDR
jgi:holin-like protein